MRTEELASIQLEPQIQLTDWSRIDRTLIAERATTILSATPRPFVRWAGSKQRLLSQLIEHLPGGYRTYFEPFLGAASMYFLLRPEQARLNDFCEPLIEMYQTVSTNSIEVYEALSQMDLLDKEYYYKLRKEVPEDPISRASRFIYLNRAGWNGLYRVNARGEFNVPYGNPRSPNGVDHGNFLSASKQLATEGTVLSVGDFEDTLSTARPGDLVFLDPPYASSKRRESFVDYNEKLFTWEDQRRLAARAESLRQAGAHVIVTNAYNSAIRALYPNFSEHALIRRSSLASDVSLRGSVAESVFVS